MSIIKSQNIKILYKCSKHGNLTDNDHVTFNKRKWAKKDGEIKVYFRYSCKRCKNEISLQWKKNNPEKVKNSILKEKFKENYPIRKRVAVLRKYGLSIKDYEILLKKQNGLCYICGKEETALDWRYKKLKMLSVDHCHSSEKEGIMKIRRLLCSRCNYVLGRIEDSIELSEKFTQYLKEHK